LSTFSETSLSDKALISFLIIDAGFSKKTARLALEWLKLDKLSEEEKEIFFKIRLNPKDAAKAEYFAAQLNNLNWRLSSVC
jgi:hypothetical protein